MYQEQVNKAKQPGPMTCPTCGEELYSPMDKLSILLHGECSEHLNEIKGNNLIKLSMFL